MLILVGEKGTAAVVFGKEIDKGVHYSFRYRPVGGGPEVKGESLVCERVRLVPAKDDPKKNTVIDMGSKLIIEAAKIRIEWSYSKPGKGFVYYVPEKLKVLIGHARDFNTVDLDRFQEPQ